MPHAPGGLFGLATVFTARRDPIDFFRQHRDAYGDVVQLKLGPFKYIITHRPSVIQRVFVENAKNYMKSPLYRGLRPVLGNGLLISEGDFWRKQRRLTQPAFHRERLEGFVLAMANDARDMCTRLNAIGGEIDAHVEMMRVTLRIAGHTLVSTDLESDAKDIGHAVTVAVEFANIYGLALVQTPLWIPTPLNLRFRRAMRTLDAMIDRIIEGRRRSNELGSDLLGMLMGSRDENDGGAMNNRQLRDELMTLILAGHETTANLLSWTLWLLAQYPAVEARAREEVHAALAGRLPTFDDVSKLSYLRAILDETMRLYPPAWSFERQAIEEDVADGYRIKAGTVVGICTYTLHRDPNFWSEPDVFKPERFLAGAAERTKHSYLPFGAGPRVCIGNQFAIVESVVVLAVMLQRLNLSLIPGQSVALEPQVTLRPKPGIQMRVNPRS